MLSCVPKRKRARRSMTDTGRNMRKEPGVLFVFSAPFFTSLDRVLCPQETGTVLNVAPFMSRYYHFECSLEEANINAQ